MAVSKNKKPDIYTTNNKALFERYDRTDLITTIVTCSIATASTMAGLRLVYPDLQLGWKIADSIAVVFPVAMLTSTAARAAVKKYYDNLLKKEFRKEDNK